MASQAAHGAGDGALRRRSSGGSSGRHLRDSRSHSQLLGVNRVRTPSAGSNSRSLESSRGVGWGYTRQHGDRSPAERSLEHACSKGCWCELRRPRTPRLGPRERGREGGRSREVRGRCRARRRSSSRRRRGARRRPTARAKARRSPCPRAATTLSRLQRAASGCRARVSSHQLSCEL